MRKFQSICFVGGGGSALEVYLILCSPTSHTFHLSYPDTACNIPFTERVRSVCTSGPDSDAV
jgi:hypothetical protein